MLGKGKGSPKITEEGVLLLNQLPSELHVPEKLVA
jgi:hypothetical protein